MVSEKRTYGCPPFSQRISSYDCKSINDKANCKKGVSDWVKQMENLNIMIGSTYEQGLSDFWQFF